MIPAQQPKKPAIMRKRYPKNPMNPNSIAKLASVCLISVFIINFTYIKVLIYRQLGALLSVIFNTFRCDIFVYEK